MSSTDLTRATNRLRFSPNLKMISARHVVNGITLVCLAISIFEICAWILSLSNFTQRKAGAPEVVLDTALCILLAAVGLWLNQRSKRAVVRGIALTLSVVGGANFSIRTPYLSLQQLLLPFSASYGQMKLGAALVFMMMGVGLLLLSRSTLSRQQLLAVALLGTFISSLGLITLLDHATGLSILPWWDGFFLNMEVPMAVNSCLLGSALIASYWREIAQSPQQLRILAAMIAIAGLLLLFAGVDATVITTADLVSTNRVEIHDSSDKISSLMLFVENIRKAESGQRGYLLIGESHYLKAYLEGRQAFTDLAPTLGFADKLLLVSARQKMDELKQTLDLEQAGRHEDALNIVRSSRGLDLMEQIEAQAGAIENRLRKQLWQKLDANRKSGSLVKKTVLVSLGLATLFALVALFFVMTEIRRRSRIEAVLAKTNDDLREQTAKAKLASQAKSSFVASMSHEIRTPMNAILGMADMLWESELSEAQRHYVEVFRRAGTNLLTLINDVLDLSKIESGHFGLEHIDFDLYEVVDQVIEILGPKAEAKGLSIFTHVEPGTNMSVIGDPTRLQQVLLNLIGNAIKFTAEGRVSLKVRPNKLGGETTHFFEVSDTGIGIVKDKLDLIFEDFSQAESSTTRRYGGTGLGLGISRRLVSFMGGQLYVRSNPNDGSTFYFDIALPAATEIQARAGKLDEIAGKSVLIVDNNPTNRSILGDMCAAWGMNVSSCASGYEAIATVKNRDCKPFTLALIDRLMPGMDGFESGIKIQALCPEVKILIVSSDSLTGDVSRCRELGFSGHLMKPIRRTQLLRQVLKALSIAQEQSVEDNAGLTAGSAQPAASVEPQCQVLVAEDSEDNRLLLAAYCKGTAYQLTFVENGQEALVAYESGRYSLIAMDINMPVMDGLVATKTIRSIEKDEGKSRIPILALTANALPSDVERTREVGCDTHLSKPISKQIFLAALDQWQNHSQASNAENLQTNEPSMRVDIPEGLEELAQQYMTARQQELPVIANAIDRLDFDRLCTLAHNLKGSGTSYGFPGITQLGGAMETSAKAGDATTLSQQLLELSKCINTASELMNLPVNS